MLESIPNPDSIPVPIPEPILELTSEPIPELTPEPILIPEPIPIPEPLPESIPGSISETDSEPTIGNRFQKNFPKRLFENDSDKNFIFPITSPESRIQVVSEIPDWQFFERIVLICRVNW